MVEFLGFVVGLCLVIIFCLGAALAETYSLIRFHKEVNRLLSGNIEIERRQKRYWRILAIRLQRDEVKRG